MSDAIVVAIIGTVGTVAVGAMQVVHGRRLRAIGRDAKEAREQTANTHDTNLRDDIDKLREGQAVLGQDLGLVMETFRTVHDDVRGIRRDINGLREDNGEIRRKQRIDASRARRDLRDHIAECTALKESTEKGTQP